MRIASINCQKRLTNPKALNRLRAWLSKHDIALLLTQEPWPHTTAAPVSIPFYDALGGNSKVFAWAAAGYRIQKPELIYPHWQALRLGYLTISNCYLDAYRRDKRSAQLDALRGQILGDRDRPNIIVGDFNLAPDLHDGLEGGQPSNFNGPDDRGALRVLKSELRLVDATHRDITGRQEFTVRRNIQGRSILFRCDLCLVSDYLFAGSALSVVMDHSVRDSSFAFTDHSALILDAPVTLGRSPAAIQGDLFHFAKLDRADDPPDIGSFPHKTAIARTDPSSVAVLLGYRGLAKRLGGTHRILDYGCGRGRDVAYYRELGFEAVGYDPYRPFGYADPPSGEFDLVCLAYVINVLPDCWQRLETIRAAAKYMRPGGYMLVATRSPEAIEQQARSKGWKRHNDGYWSHEGKGTFQKGITEEELGAIVTRVGLRPHPLPPIVYADSSTRLILATRP